MKKDRNAPKLVPLGEALTDDLDALCTPEAIAAQVEGAAEWWRGNVPPSVTSKGAEFDLRAIPDAEVVE